MNAATEVPNDATHLELMLTQIRRVARDTNLYTFERADGGLLPSAEAGAHIGLRLPNGLERQYSLVFTDPRPTSYTVGVKKDAGSRGGSRWIHDELKVGMTIGIDAPRNNFPLTEDAEATALIAGGIGITPIYAMAMRLEALGRAFSLHYSCRSRMDAAFARELLAKPCALVHFDDEAGGTVLPIVDIVRGAPKGAHLYCCGPAPMLAAFEAACAADQRPPSQIHVEYFTQQHEAAASGGYVVQLARAKQELAIPAGKSILQCCLDAGLKVAHSCEEGICGACETKVLEGVPDHRDSILSAAERASGKTMMICCSGAKSPRLVLDL